MKDYREAFVAILAISVTAVLVSGCTSTTDDTPSTGAAYLEVIETEQVTELPEVATTPDRG